MKVLFGSIITSGRGKIGGQFVKRIPNGHSINNLPRTKSKQSLLTGSKLQVLSTIFSNWVVLNPLTRDSWSENAATYPVIDKFGNPKFLTGRQFYIKCISQGYNYNGLAVDPTSFSSIVPTATGEEGTYDFEFGQINYDFVLLSTAAKMFVRIDKLKNNSNSPRYINSKALSVFELPTDTNINVYPLLIEKFPTATYGNVFQFSFTPFNSHGILGAPLIFVKEITA